MVSHQILHSLADGTGPSNDGWYWIYKLFGHIAPVGSAVRRIVCGYFAPSVVELAGDGILYRILGVPQFGRVIPTGGVSVRRVTRARMAPYTLAAPTLSSARAFYYRACVFEALHLPFFLALLALAVQRATIGRIDYAIQETMMNLVVNLYPMMHHRNTRRRIVALLSRRDSRRETRSSTSKEWRSRR